MNVKTTSKLLAATLAMTFAAGSTAVFADDMAKMNPADEKSEQPVSDTWITTKVKTELAATDGVKSTDISVETVNGVVTLIGVLESSTAVDKAVAATRSVKGVVNVDASGLKAK